MDISRTACMALRIATDRCPNPLDKIYLKKKNRKGGKWGGGVNRWFNFLHKAAFRARG